MRKFLLETHKLSSYKTKNLPLSGISHVTLIMAKSWGTIIEARVFFCLSTHINVGPQNNTRWLKDCFYQFYIDFIIFSVLILSQIRDMFPDFWFSRISILFGIRSTHMMIYKVIVIWNLLLQKFIISWYSQRGDVVSKGVKIGSQRSNYLNF